MYAVDAWWEPGEVVIQSTLLKEHDISNTPCIRLTLSWLLLVASSTIVKLFWPIQAWKSSGLVVVLDDDSSDDHIVGTILGNLQLISPINVRYEQKPPENTTCSSWTREGYARQQYSNFYADLYTDADYVAIIDGDASFTAPGIFENCSRASALSLFNVPRTTVTNNTSMVCF